MSKKILKNTKFQGFLCWIVHLYIRFVFITTRWQFINFETIQENLNKNQGFITCFWHNRLLMLPYAWPHKNYPFHMLISAHSDGAMISRVVKYFGIETIAGSTSKGGTGALIKIVKNIKLGFTIGMTPDGPRGPKEQVSLGTVASAYLAQAPLIPVSYTVKHKKILKTWDNFLIPYPFNKGIMAWGDIIPPPIHKNNFEEVRHTLEKALNDLNIKIEHLL